MLAGSFMEVVFTPEVMKMLTYIPVTYSKR